MPISALPTPPSRSDAPQDFSDRADALLGALPGFVTEANALQSDVNSKESAASSYATIATNKAAEAQGHATTASTKASEAAAAAIAAAAAASNAEIAFDSFDDKYLGSKASDPATDNDGNALLVGALYWNTSVGAVRVWNGSSWLSMAADASIVDFQQAGAGAVVRTAQDKLRELVSVKDFGAVGDGVTDDSVALQSAITAASNSPTKTLVLEAGAIYSCSSNLDIVTNGLRIEGNGAVIDGSARPAGANALDTYGLGITGSAGLNINVTSDVASGDNRINVASTDGIVSGDYILLKSTQQFPNGATGTASYKGMIHKVRSVTNSTELVLHEGSLFSITSLVGGVQNAYIAKLSMVEGVQIENVQVRMGGTGKAHTGIKIYCALNPQISDCTTTDTEAVGVAVSYTVGGRIAGGEFADATSPAAGGGPVTTQYGYGVLPGTAVKGLIVSGSRFRNCRHAVAGGGTYPSIGVRIEKCFVEGQRLASALHGPSYALDCHEDCLFWVFNENVVFSHRQPNASAFSDGDGGMLIRGSHSTVTNNKIFNTAQYGIRVRNTDGPTSFSRGTIISGNTVGDCQAGGIMLEGGGTAAAIRDNIVSNNVIYGFGNGYGGIHLASANNVIIDGNIIDGQGTGSYGVILSGGVSNLCSNVCISGNRIVDVLAVAISATQAQDLTITDNKITGSADDGIQVIASTLASVTGNTVSTSTGPADGVSIGSGSSSILIANNNMTKSVAATSTAAGTRIVGTTDITVNGNVFSGYINGVQADSASSWLICTNNNGRNCTSSTNINAGLVNQIVDNNF